MLTPIIPTAFKMKRKFFEMLLGSPEKITFWAIVFWAGLTTLHVYRYGELAYMGYVYLILAVLAPVNYYLERRKLEREKPQSK